MKLITDIDIEKIFKMLMAAGENPFALILKKMEQEQPALVEYLFEADEEDLNDDERDLLVNAGIIAWNIIRETLGEAPVKSDDFIDLRLERNMDLFEKEQETDDGSDEHFDNLFSADNDQPMLMRFLLDIFMERPEGYQGEIRDEMVPILMLHVKTVVDCLVLDEEPAADVAEEDDEEEFDEYSDENFEEVKRIVASLYGDFRKSPFYMKMAHRDKENAELVVTAFGEMMYS
ncbi:MAG TPA: hypothetical protein ENN21_01875, partial [Spirochaetes bacterium]|nr:hypothetical protein [Spirochaetota bacterium]